MATLVFLPMKILSYGNYKLRLVCPWFLAMGGRQVFNGKKPSTIITLHRVFVQEMIKFSKCKTRQFTHK